MYRPNYTGALFCHYMLCELINDSFAFTSLAKQSKKWPETNNKTVAKNWDSKRHLLELSWLI
jgi:hypothetical protein